MKKSIVLYFGFVMSMFIGERVFAQASFTIGASYCTFRMTDLKGLNEELSKNYNVEGKVVSSFPPYIGYDATLSLQAKQHRIGFFWSYNSTGSRVSYSDYSGSSQYDQKLSSHQVGGYYGYAVPLKNELWKLIPSLRLGLIYTDYEIKSYLKIGDQSSSEKLDFVSKSILVSPGLLLQRDFLPWLFLSADLRYLIDIPQNLVWARDHKTYLFNEQNTPLAAQWSGLRFVISVGVKLKESAK